MIKNFINSDFEYDKRGPLVTFIKKYDAWEVNQSFKTSNFTILLIRVGSLKLQINNRIQQFTTQDLIFIPQGTICRILSIDGIHQICIMSFSSDIAIKSNLIIQQRQFFHYLNTKNHQSIMLKSIDFKLMLRLFKLIHLKNKKIEHCIYHTELRLHSINLFLHEIKIIYNKYHNEITFYKTRKELLVLQFLNHITVHCKEQHSVQFFADELCITQGYLNKVIKQITHKTPKHLICEALLIEAKVLLKNPDLPIINIANELEFNNYPSFYIFFKRHTSLSPSEYRSQLNLH